MSRVKNRPALVAAAAVLINKRDRLRFLPAAEADEQRRHDKRMEIENQLQEIYRKLED